MEVKVQAVGKFATLFQTVKDAASLKAKEGLDAVKQVIGLESREQAERRRDEEERKTATILEWEQKVAAMDTKNELHSERTRDSSAHSLPLLGSERGGFGHWLSLRWLHHQRCCVFAPLHEVCKHNARIAMNTIDAIRRIQHADLLTGTTSVTHAMPTCPTYLTCA